ncbi:hypothetical protein [Streptomyces sp. NPDC005438]|uniref:hypothetical protein n=1 Tax=Streptomyces sp. NPDC005438 TaxID=3156880 RepID=UPI0033A672D2
MTAHDTQEPGAPAYARAVLRIRGAALALALLPTALAVIGHTARAQHLLPPSWDTPLTVLTLLAAATLLGTAALALAISRARPTPIPTVEVPHDSAPDLHHLIQRLAHQLQVPAPHTLALTPDCDSWLEDQHPPRRPLTRAPTPRHTLVIGSPFLWWMRPAELRALLAPVVAGTAPASDPDIRSARRLVRALDAASTPHPRTTATRPWHALVARCARALLRPITPYAQRMEQLLALGAAEHAREVDLGPRIAAQEQVGLAYAGWDRLLTRVAEPAWRLGRWPHQLHTGVAHALAELSQRDRLAGDFSHRLDTPAASALLTDPARMDETVSLLTAELCHGPTPDHWSPVDWDHYPLQVVDQHWRRDARRLFHTLDGLPEPAPEEAAPTPEPASVGRAPHRGAPTRDGGTPAPDCDRLEGPTLARLLRHLTPERLDTLAARLSAVHARTEPPTPGGTLQPPRTGRELMADHLTAAVCCAAVDSGRASPDLDWLDGPALRHDGHTLQPDGPVGELVDHGDPTPLRDWMAHHGIRADRPIRLE